MDYQPKRTNPESLGVTFQMLSGLVRRQAINQQAMRIFLRLASFNLFRRDRAICLPAAFYINLDADGGSHIFLLNRG